MIRRLIIAVLMLFAPLSAQAAERRVALVIANSAYAQIDPLKNPVNDGKLVSDALKKAGFTVDLRDNLNLSQFMHALRDFRGQADGADVALIYYAGHGAQADGQNYLIPTDAEMAAERDLRLEGVDMEFFMTILGGAKLRVAVIDACRNNPFKSAAAVTTVTSGLAQVDVDDVLVIFSAAPGKTASDGGGANSPFAEALAKRIPEPGLVIQRLGGVVRDDVIAATGSTQRPFISASITGQPITLVPGRQIALATPAPPSPLRPRTGAPRSGSASAPPSPAVSEQQGLCAAAPELPTCSGSGEIDDDQSIERGADSKAMRLVALSQPREAFTVVESWTATDPRIPLSSVKVERGTTGVRVSGLYPATKRDGSVAPDARVIRLVPYRVVEGRTVRLPQLRRVKIGYWKPGTPFSMIFANEQGGALPPGTEIRLCIGENDGPGRDFCFYSPNLVKGGAQQLRQDLSRPAAGPGMPDDPGIARRRRRR